MRSLVVERLQVQGINCRNADENDQKCNHMKHSGESEHCAVTHSMIQQVTDQFPKSDSSHRTTESNQTRDGAHDLLRKQVGRQDHHESGPGLLPEIRNAEERDCPGNVDVRNQNDERH